MEREPFEGTPYRTIGLIGRGGSARIYEVEDMSLGSRFAAKVLIGQLEADLSREERMRRIDRMRLEAQTAARLGHPNIPSLFKFDVLARSGTPYLIMERLVGVDLWSELGRRKRFPVAEAIRIIRRVLSALHAAHREGIIHRDIKPENIFLHQLPKGEPTVKVLDWGLAKVLETATERAPDPLIFPTEEGVTVGTLAYLAPEQLANHGADARTDIYAAATVLYELVAGAGPFENFGSTSTALERAKWEQAPEPLATRLSDPSLRELDRILRKALACEPSHRHQSVADFDRELVAMTREYRAPLIPSVIVASATGTVALLAAAYRVWVW